MGKQIYNKLVRDKIPEIIRAKGGRPITRLLDEKEYFKALVAKLQEEVVEFEAEPSIEELADIKEVMLALCLAISIRPSELEDTRRHKAKTNGRFKKRIFLEGVEE